MNTRSGTKGGKINYYDLSGSKFSSSINIFKNKQTNKKRRSLYYKILIKYNNDICISVFIFRLGWPRYNFKNRIKANNITAFDDDEFRFFCIGIVLRAQDDDVHQET